MRVPRPAGALQSPRISLQHARKAAREKRMMNTDQQCAVCVLEGWIRGRCNCDGRGPECYETQQCVLSDVAENAASFPYQPSKKFAKKSQPS